MAGLYVHIPFCRRKCFYCDFFSLGARSAPWGEYAAALAAEWLARRRELRGEPLRTLYIGGGTPSLMPAPLLEQFLSLLPRGQVEEFTVEVNPEDVTPALVEGYARMGVNRVSMGLQSLDGEVLRIIGRRHSPEQARNSYELLRPLGNVSVDLIYGLPGQDMDSWRATVAEALRWKPEHVSAYSLMWEEGTPLAKMRRMGRVGEAAQELSEAMYLHLLEATEKAGLRQYEVSNFALPGRESRHNSSYWSGTPYLGLGAGAHSYDGENMRKAAPASLRAYLDDPAGCHEAEWLSGQDLVREHIMTRLRTCAGIDLADYRARFGAEEAERLRRAAGALYDPVAGRIALPGREMLTLDATVLSLWP